MYVRISLYASKYLYLSLSDENKPKLRTFKLKNYKITTASLSAMPAAMNIIWFTNNFL